MDSHTHLWDVTHPHIIKTDEEGEEEHKRLHYRRNGAKCLDTFSDEVLLHITWFEGPNRPACWGVVYHYFLNDFSKSDLTEQIYANILVTVWISNLLCLDLKSTFFKVTLENTQMQWLIVRQSAFTTLTTLIHERKYFKSCYLKKKNVEGVSSPKNENSVMNYSPSCRSKPVRPSFTVRPASQ